MPVFYAIIYFGTAGLLLCIAWKLDHGWGEYIWNRIYKYFARWPLHLD